MMKIRERVSPETRLKTGWLFPAIASFVLSEFTTGGVEKVISRTDQVGMGVFTLIGILTGVLWQWYSPRDLAERLSVPAGLLVLVVVLSMLPFGEMVSRGPDYFYLFPLGLVAGLVLTTRWQQLRAED
ncbi:hypothetical protein [Kribbella catacumbae]|uniref:hypothetical protein n=1 Tax=Kribbella catacumbae TaxID=460086 RepID=UPI000376AE46|nr:hypothetical protein [Kribbella catacumbae]